MRRVLLAALCAIQIVLWQTCDIDGDGPLQGLRIGYGPLEKAKRAKQKAILSLLRGLHVHEKC
jgi:hypothetical protein